MSEHIVSNIGKWSTLNEYAHDFHALGASGINRLHIHDRIVIIPTKESSAHYCIYKYGHHEYDLAPFLCTHELFICRRLFDSDKIYMRWYA